MTQPRDLLSVFDVANRLKLHVKTVRGYVRDGRLKAVRIGKQYRIARDDLEAFTGLPLPLTESERAKRRREVSVSCVVGIDAISPEASKQLESSLEAFARREGEQSEPLRADAIYDQDVGHLKVTLFGGVNSTAAALKLLAALLEK
ncbi:MAG: helix-turn-helix domain-containing protein [Gemmatimonadales bacterium]